jgi:hypothetical protein
VAFRLLIRMRICALLAPDGATIDACACLHPRVSAE